ncbi:hypothetical protein NWP96_06065 [Mycoplasmopsis cynos]|nr:hypothetical protein [Mycoplasmopsis cynos]
MFKLLDNFLDKGRINSLLKRFEQTDDSKKGEFTESLLIWNVYETVRRSVFEINEFKKLKKEIQEKFKDKVKILNNNQKTNHSKNVDWLKENINNIKTILKSQRWKC